MAGNGVIKLSEIEAIRNAKNWIRKNRSSENLLIRVSIQSIFWGNKVLNYMRRIVGDGEFRAICYMKVFKSKRLNQTTPFTSMDRYPAIFAGCSRYLEGREKINILSYGCSTGEEVFTLRKYFPTATIIGADINPHNIKVCKRHLVDEKITFIDSVPRKIRKYGEFDAVFCMAVLQRTPHMVTEQGITSLKAIYPFEKFEQQVIELDKYVKKGGLLIIHFSQYSFMDTVIAAKYKALGNYNQEGYSSAVFNRDSQLVKESTPYRSVFIKQYD